MTAVRSYTDKEFNLELREAFESVFDASEPYPNGPLFAPGIRARALLYPVNPQLGRVEFGALSQAARRVGDNALCISLLVPSLEPDAINHWLISLDNQENYHSLKGENTFLPNALYSPTGQWGIQVTEASYALAGGSDVFIETLFSNMPNSAEKQLYDCIAAYKSELAANRFGGPPLRAFLSHLYGEEKTQEILADAGIPPSFSEDP